MAKDRFSRFKKSNYDKDFRWGNYDSINYKVKKNRKDLNPIQEKFLMKLSEVLKKPNDLNFIISVLEVGKEPTEKQKEIIKEIIKRNK